LGEGPTTPHRKKKKKTVCFEMWHRASDL